MEDSEIVRKRGLFGPRSGSMLGGVKGDGLVKESMCVSMGRSLSVTNGETTLLHGSEPVSRGKSAIGGDLSRIHCSRALLSFLGPHLHCH